jgi:hypothetical protein
VEVQAFQYDRDRHSWKWTDERAAGADLEFRVSGVPESRIEQQGDVIVRVSLSDIIDARDTLAHVPLPLAEIDITVADPDRIWLRSPEQIVRFADTFRRVLKLIGQRIPDVQRIHLFAAVPTPVCIVMGQAINPRMSPHVALYEFNRQNTPRNEHVLTLTNAGAVEPMHAVITAVTRDVP